MKVLLLKDVYKLGRAGDVKKVADGYGRNYLLPKNLAVLATAGALKQADHIRAQATVRRAVLNQEMGSVAEVLGKLELTFPSKAGETGKLYGSITHQMIADAIKAKSGITVERHQIDVEPIRTLGEKKAHVRLTVDLMPEVRILVHREGETIAEAVEPVAEALKEEAPAAEAPVVETPVVEEASTPAETKE
jgi:large subunit ribosomal protein L9